MDIKSENEKKQREHRISFFLALFIGCAVAYFLAYAFAKDDEGAMLGMAGMSLRIANGQFLFRPSVQCIGAVLIGVGAGVLTYLLSWMDSKKKDHYPSEAAAGTGGFMTDKEMQEYAAEHILPDPPPIDKGLPVVYDIDKDKDKYSGNIIMSEHFCRPIDSRQMIGNNNLLIIGGAGSGKTRFIIKPNLLQMNASYVITDPSGEIVNSLGTVLKNHGYKIKIFNISDMMHSNCYNPLEYIRDDAGVRMVIDCLINNTKKGPGGGDNQFFEDAEKLLYSACIYYLMDYGDSGNKNFAGVMKMINASNVDESNPSLRKSPLDKLFDTIPPESLARQNYTAFKQAAGKTLKSIIISCVTRLQPFLIPQVANLTKTDELHLENIGYEKTAVFIITPQADRTYAFLASMLYSQLFETLYFIGEQQRMKTGTERLPIPVRCMMDEFANIGEVPEFPSKLATMRKYEISATIVLQGISQIESMYEKEWKSIVDNCSSIIFLGGQEVDTLKYFSEKLGKMTVRVQSDNISLGKGGASEGFQNTGREVMSAEELGRMPTDKCVIFTQSMRPVYDTKYRYENHPYYPQTADKDGRNAFNYSEMSVYKTNKYGNADSLLKAQAEGARYREEKKSENAEGVKVNIQGNPYDWIFHGGRKDDNIFREKVEWGILNVLQQKGPVYALKISGLNVEYMENYIRTVSKRSKKSALVVFNDMTISEDETLIAGIAIDSDNIGIDKFFDDAKYVEKAGEYYFLLINKYNVDSVIDTILNKEDA